MLEVTAQVSIDWEPSTTEDALREIEDKLLEYVRSIIVEFLGLLGVKACIAQIVGLRSFDSNHGVGLAIASFNGGDPVFRLAFLYGSRVYRVERIEVALQEFDFYERREQIQPLFEGFNAETNIFRMSALSVAEQIPRHLKVVATKLQEKWATEMPAEDEVVITEVVITVVADEEATACIERVGTEEATATETEHLGEAANVVEHEACEETVAVVVACEESPLEKDSSPDPTYPQPVLVVELLLRVRLASKKALMESVCELYPTVFQKPAAGSQAVHVAHKRGLIDYPPWSEELVSVTEKGKNYLRSHNVL